MARKLFLIWWLGMAMWGFAQSSDHNWVKEKVYRVPTSVPLNSPALTEAFVTVRYYDGLGRVEQEIQKEMSPGGGNLVTHHEYDAFGRKAKEFLPYPVSAGDLDFVTDAAWGTASYYQSAYGTSVCYGETQFEDSPLNRPLKKGAPGDAWALGSGHEIKYAYDVNTDNEVRLFRVDVTYDPSTDMYVPALRDEGYYAGGTLYKFVTADENHDLSGEWLTIEYKDKEGRVVLKRQTTPNGNADTYYVYDDFGNLTYVIPPLAAGGVVSPAVLDELCYQYVYDSRNRPVAKKLPGVRWRYTAYDRLDRVRAVGPVRSPFEGGGEGWLVTLYDRLDRPVLSGYKAGVADAAARKAVQDEIYGAPAQSVTAASGATTVNGVSVYYTTDAWPQADFHVLTQTYYDDYRFDSHGVPADIAGQPVRQGTDGNLSGLTTGRWVRILTREDQTDHYVSLTYYEDD
ncbi:MAG: RHS repeat-associated core domain-containing protein, partial [Chlorobi bacterium]|nr:RHS repeat-associated core domain-containing protein [Chlorobiota bacterium]